MDAFAAFARTFPDNAALLIDTYDIEAAAKKIIQLARRLQKNRRLIDESDTRRSVTEKLNGYVRQKGCFFAYSL